MKIIQDEIYCSIYYISGFNLSDTEKIKLIDQFHEDYFSTAQSVETFAVEFQRVTSHILSNCIPVNLEYLIDFQENIALCLNEYNAMSYNREFLHFRESNTARA